MTEALLLAQIKTFGSRRKAGEALAIQGTSRWQGREEISFEGEPWKVAQCDSPLQIRERLSSAAGQPLVIVTGLSTQDVGEDVRARICKGRVLPVEAWDALAERFHARSIEASLRGKDKLAEAALEALGTTEPRPAPSGVVTAEVVWDLVLPARLGLPSARPDVLQFLEWMVKPKSAEQWRDLGPELQAAVTEWLRLPVGEVISLLRACLESEDGGDALAIGIALGTLLAEPADPEARVALGAARVRLERFVGNQRLELPFAKQWRDGAERWAGLLKGDTQRLRAELDRADQVLVDVGAADYALLGSWSPAGFQSRLDAFATSLSKAKGAAAAYASLAAHETASCLTECRNRLERATMAMRLERWLERPETAATNLADAIVEYENESSWVDWARFSLISGDEKEGVSRAYQKVFALVTSRRERENQAFADLLVAATRTNQLGEGVLPIEGVLERVVGRLVKDTDARILVLVMDGMSMAVWREFASELSRHGWPELAPKSDDITPRVAVTALPSVTNISRASLLCGALVSGGQDIESRGFAEHPALKSGVLFHKDEVGATGGELSEALRKELRSEKRRVVGAIVNVVDDSLAGPEQLAIRWTLAEMPVVHALLNEAKEAGRVIVVVSDHGHVFDRAAEMRRFEKASDRFRLPITGAPSSGELLVSGTRVRIDGGTYIAPTSEAIRYVPNRRRGYHGGLTPQECLVPVSVLTSRWVPEGWEPAAAVPPEWWLTGGIPAEPVITPPVRKPKQPKRVEPSLFDDSPASEDWITELIESEVFARQMELNSARMQSAQVSLALRLLVAKNGVLTKTAFCQQMGVLPLRIDGVVASLRRVLNIDGCQILSVDASQTVRLDSNLLREQFGIEERTR
jgi:hypothetical protein